MAIDTTYLDSDTDSIMLARPALLAIAKKVNESVSVKDFGAVGDGVTDDTAAIQAAVTHGFTTSDKLYWPDGTYLTTASISNLHVVQHAGPGAIFRNSGLFYPSPTSDKINIFYVSSAGLAVNDGLSASQPMLTMSNALDTLENYGPHLIGKWKVSFSAGTYSGYNRFPYNLTSEKLVEFYGPDVGGHPNVPTCLFDAVGASHKMLVSLGGKIKIKDIKIQNYGQAGIQMTSGLLVTENVHTQDCYIGIGSYEGQLLVSGGIHHQTAGYTTGYARIQSMFNNRHSVGYDYAETTGNPTIAATLANAPQITSANTSGRGVHLQEGATGHVYGLIQGFSKGLEIFSRSRANLDSTDFRLNNVGIEVEYGCDTGGAYVLNKGTANANTESIRYVGGGISYNSYPSPGTASEYRVAQNLTGSIVTGTTGLATIGSALYTLDGQDFDSAGSSLRMFVAGSISGTAGTKSIQMRVAGVNVGSVPFVASATGAFVAEITLRQTSPGNQYVSGWGICGLAGSSGAADAGTGATSVNLADGTTKAITCSVQLGNAADSIDVKVIDLYRAK